MSSSIPAFPSACLQNLHINLTDASERALQEYCGRLLMIAFVHKDCDGAFIVDMLQTLHRDYGERGFLPVLLFVDLPPTEGFKNHATYPIGRGRRREVADLLGIPMSGFPIPSFMFVDRTGYCRATYGVKDQFCRRTPENSRALIERLLSESETTATKEV